MISPFGAGPFRHGDRPVETAVAALTLVEPLTLVLLFILALALNNQRVFGDLDFEVLFF